MPMRSLAISVLFTSLSTFSLCGQLPATPSARRSLEGLDGVTALVEEVDTSVAYSGLTSSNIQTDVEVSLRAAGIPVLTRFEYPVLYVSLRVMAVTDQSSLYLYSVRVELNQFVIPSRNSSVQPMRGITWLTLKIGTVGRDRLSHVREVIKDAVNQFVNDYLAANPRR